MKLIYRIKPPCSKCPYALGLVRTVINPCPQCKANGYRTYERFQKKLPEVINSQGEEALKTKSKR